MVTTRQAIEVLRPDVEFDGPGKVIVGESNGTVTIQWPPIYGPKPTQAQLDAVTQAQVDAATNAKELAANPERNDLRKRVQGFIDEYKTFDDIASPTNAQILAHARRMNKQLLVILRFMKREML